MKEEEPHWPTLVGVEIAASENFPVDKISAITKLDTVNRTGPVKEVRAWFALDEQDNKTLHLFSSVLQTSHSDPSKDTWIVVTCDARSYYRSLGNMEDSGGFVSRVYGNAKIEELDESPNEHMSSLLQGTIPKCEHNPRMFGPDVENVQRSDLSFSPEEAGDSFVPVSSPEFKEPLSWKENEVDYGGIHGKDWKKHSS